MKLTQFLTLTLLVSFSTQALADCYSYETDVQDAIGKKRAFIAENMTSPELTRLNSELATLDSIDREIDRQEVQLAEKKAKFDQRALKIESLRAQGKLGKVAEEEKEQRGNQIDQSKIQARLLNLRDNRAKYGDRQQIVSQINVINRQIQDPRLQQQLNNLEVKVLKAQDIVSMCRELEELKVSCRGTNSAPEL